jgi:peptide/nickel transport system ATP-binding protein
VVLDMLKELQQQYGFACLFVSHDLAVVDHLADEVVVMKKGQVVEQGPADRVLHFPEEEYTKELLAAAPVPDPDAQRVRREARLKL